MTWKACLMSTTTLPDVGVFACPCSEGLQLRFWLAHPSVEEIELAKFPRAHSCIAVDRVVSLVMLYKADDIVFS